MTKSEAVKLRSLPPLPNAHLLATNKGHGRPRTSSPVAVVGSDTVLRTLRFRESMTHKGMACTGRVCGSVRNCFVLLPLSHFCSVLERRVRGIAISSLILGLARW